MADLIVDFALLTSIQRSLTVQAGELADVHGQQSPAAVYGSSAVAGAMDAFAGNWDKHRQALTGTMRDLAEMSGQTGAAFHDTDYHLARSLATR